MTMSRRLLLAALEPDAARRAAWEVLVGPVDWHKAARLERQDDEPFATDPAVPEAALPNLRGPDMVLTAEAGLLADFTGGPDKLADIREEMEKVRAEEADLPPEERAALEAHRATLLADGWTEDAQGNLWSPDPSE